MRAKFINENAEREVPEISPKEIESVIEKNMPYLLKYDPKDEGPDVRGEPMDDFKRWSIWSIEVPEIEKQGMGVALMFLDYGDGIEVKFYTDSVAFVPGEHNDEYTEWVDAVPVNQMSEEGFEEVLEDMYEYYGIEDDDNEYSDNMLGYK